MKNVNVNAKKSIASLVNSNNFSELKKNELNVVFGGNSLSAASFIPVNISSMPTCGIVGIDIMF